MVPSISQRKGKVSRSQGAVHPYACFCFQGSFLQHIQQETGAHVSLRGKASDMDPQSAEPMHVHIEYVHETTELIITFKPLTCIVYF